MQSDECLSMVRQRISLICTMTYQQALKGTVPSPVLKHCLDDMCLAKLDDENMFADSDEEEDDDAKDKKPSATFPKAADASDDPYAKSLSIKAAKSAGATIYYVVHNKLANNGNGLDPEVRNQLISQHATTKSELAFLQESEKAMLMQATALHMEPTNEDASGRLVSEEIMLKELEAQLEAARGLKSNEQYKLQTKRRIENMASFWRKRKRLTMEFLTSMEECTDGAISTKKCLAGDGQIDLESDELAVKTATAYYNGLKNRKTLAVKHGAAAKKKAKTSESSGMKPTATFVAVLLDSIGCVERVYVDQERD